jgi:hypothetical protein
MWEGYADILSKLGKPLWWDDNAVPRYCPFSPERVGVYNDIIVLFTIECQECAKRMKVVRSFECHSEEEKAKALESLKHIHFGDPPFHYCSGSGESMGSCSVRINEVWIKKFFDERSEDFTPELWRRHPELEGELEEDAEYLDGDDEEWDFPQCGEGEE